MTSGIVIHWFRNDLRLGDNLALREAAAAGGRLLPVYCHDPAEEAITRWGFVRRGAHRQAFLSTALVDLDAQLRERGSRLLQLHGAPAEVLPALARAIGADAVVCEAVAAPEEEDQVAALRAAGLEVRTVWQSSLLAPAALPFAVARLPKVFTDFRRAVESVGLQPPARPGRDGAHSWLRPRGLRVLVRRRHRSRLHRRRHARAGGHRLVVEPHAPSRR